MNAPLHRCPRLRRTVTLLLLPVLMAVLFLSAVGFALGSAFREVRP